MLFFLKYKHVEYRVKLLESEPIRIGFWSFVRSRSRKSVKIMVLRNTEMQLAFNRSKSHYSNL
jgi:hypothetical protein